MEIRALNKAQMERVYYDHMKRAFPPSELKSLQVMERMRDSGRYEPLGMYDGERLVGYALMWLEPGVPFALLDYLGTVKEEQGKGLGTALLALLGEYYAPMRGIFGEAERDNSPDEQERALQRRRLDFYLRNGFRYAGYDCALFGVHYETLIRGAGDVSAQELLAVHQSMYQKQIPPQYYERFIQLPLAPGEQPWPAVEWKEE